MQVLLSGTDFPHRKGEMSVRKTVSFYGVYHFSTPFLYEKDGRLCRGKAGDLLINPPGTVVHHGAASQDESYVNDWMHVSADFGELLARYPLPCCVPVSLGPQKLLGNAIRQIRTEQLLKHPGYEEKIRCILTQTVIDLQRLYTRSLEQSAELPIVRARETILSHPEQSWTLEAMAALTGYSVSRFCALYSARFQKSPKAELLEIRLAMAKDRLRYSDLSVSAVAAECGFQSLYYFSKYFRQQTGLSPTAFREKHTSPGL